jgi:hypothetical protein
MALSPAEEGRTKAELRGRVKKRAAAGKKKPLQVARVSNRKPAGKGRPKAGQAKPKARPKQVKKADVAKAARKPAKTEFSYPQDSGGKLLAWLLAPHRQAPRLASGYVTKPLRPQAPASLERPDLPLSDNLARLPRGSQDAKRTPLRPGLLPDCDPLDWYRANPSVPRRPRLAAKRPARWPFADVNRPIELPFLALGQSDRASLDDPTAEISLKAALAGTATARREAAPFVRIDLPDPFEHRKAVRLRKPPPEELPLNTGSQAPPGK